VAALQRELRSEPTRKDLIMAKAKPSVALRKRMDAQLALLGNDAEWTEKELEYLDLAGRAVDRAAVVQGVLDAELGRDEPRPSHVVRLSAELRGLERQTAALVAMLNPDGSGPAKSERHQRAARVRWDQQRAMHG
jgi:hypothetical protein